MKIKFKDKKLRELCKLTAAAVKKLVNTSAKKLQTRLANIPSSKCVPELITGHPHPLKGDRLGQFSLDLAGGWRLVFASANDPVPLGEDASVNWSAVTIVCIDYIGDDLD